MQLLSVKEVSKILKIKEPTIYAWAKSGKIPSYKINGLVRFHGVEVQEWFENSRRIKIIRELKPNITHRLDIKSIIEGAIDEYN